MLNRADSIRIEIAKNGFVVYASATSREVNRSVAVCATVEEVLQMVRSLLAEGAVKSLSEAKDGNNIGPDSPEVSG